MLTKQDIIESIEEFEAVVEAKYTDAWAYYINGYSTIHREIGNLPLEDRADLGERLKVLYTRLRDRERTLPG